MVCWLRPQMGFLSFLPLLPWHICRKTRETCFHQKSSQRKSYFNTTAYSLMTVSNVFFFINKFIVSRSILFLFIDYFMAWQLEQNMVNAARL